MGNMQQEAADLVEEKHCRKCGFKRDSDLRAETIYNSTQGKETFTILCLHPQSPYLPEVRKRLIETGKV